MRFRDLGWDGVTVTEVRNGAGLGPTGFQGFLNGDPLSHSGSYGRWQYGQQPGAPFWGNEVQYVYL